MNKNNGFTLIEILVVIFIVSIISGVALLSLHHNQDKQLAAYANELVQIMRLAEEQAMLQPATLGLSLDSNRQAFHFSSYQHQQEGDESAWQPLQDQVFRKHWVPQHIDVKITTNTPRESNAHPQIIISSLGEITPFTIYISQKGEEPRYIVTGDADGHITSQLLS